MPLRFSIVIPNYNSGSTLERAIRSIIDQNYPSLQLIVCDSESTDNSREIIERYRDRISKIIIRKDKGQADGLNYGFSFADGDIFGWLCADDELLPGSLAHAAELFEKHPDTDIVTGMCERVYADGQPQMSPPDPKVWDNIGIQCVIEQSATFWRGALHRKVGQLDDSFHMCFDWDFWNRLKKAGGRIIQTDRVMSRYYFSETNKSGSAGSRFTKEAFRILHNYGPMRGLLAYVYRFLYQTFDLQGCYDKPPTCTLPRSHMFIWTLALLRGLIGKDLLYKYNWHFASCQERGLKWW